MASKYKGNLKKGMRVHLYDRHYRSGEYRVEVDMDTVYTIRSIGNKQAILDRTDPDTYSSYSWRRGGRKLELYTPEQARLNRETPWGRDRFYPTNWSEYFILVGEPGWDAEINI